ncbi:P-loop containing nucleoside triphosphate hydrolase protein [Gonapodya prolifera JEL478]|uniref:p-loop containing nucleoside triphosphate hydrolase protein n=1 Tax=Gonapodya prolifera (strain JEL478) TaxID=1344416 RepID=A0A139AYP9_GONPJ|nr:P-loop containing nucleoside triphosphate hydrolase protein [Gonapodya prolifera JEL478]|eukprot:KXS21830.1 P-loop containing nucleoside triphosphate hydrolase protein [Gonapodya prolifera JEL478]
MATTENEKGIDAAGLSIPLMKAATARGPSPSQTSESTEGKEKSGAKAVRRGVDIVWDNIKAWTEVGSKKNKQTKEILRGVSGFINPGELVAILGGSGAGKTTLLNALSGRLPPSIHLSGSVLVNGAKRDRRRWKREVAYVEQEDLLLPTLTVRETLTFAAEMRLPDADYTPAQKAERVETLLNSLGLAEIANTKVGDSMKGGISGGQRKRLSIACEMVADPKTIFLDEPTSGLDAFTAFTLAEQLKKLANEGKTVLATLHMPRETIVEMFDKLILMSQGEIVWVGHVREAMEWFASLGFPTPKNTNPADHFLDIISTDNRTPAVLAESRARLEKFSTAWKDRAAADSRSRTVSGVATPTKPGTQITTAPSVDVGEGNYRKWNVSIMKEFWLLLSRDAKATYRNPAVMLATVAQALTSIILIGIVYLRLDFSQASVQSRSGLLFFITINTTFSALIPVLNAFGETRKFIVRERASGSYHVGSAFYAKLFTTLPITMGSSGGFAAIVYWMTNLHPDGFVYFKFIVIMVVMAITCMSMGMLIASIAPNAQVGSVIAPIFNLIFIVFGGNFANLDSIPVFIRWLQWISPVKYSYSALMINEFSGLTFTCDSGSTRCFATGEQVLEYFSLGSISVGVSLLVLAGLSIFLQTTALLALRRTTRPNSVII